jgi:hypothetical protein
MHDTGKQAKRQQANRQTLFRFGRVTSQCDDMIGVITAINIGNIDIRFVNGCSGCHEKSFLNNGRYLSIKEKSRFSAKTDLTNVLIKR